MNPSLALAVVAICGTTLLQEQKPAQASKELQEQKPAQASKEETLPPPRTVVVRRGLDWLVGHQSEDGRWSASHFSKSCPATDKCSGRARRATDVGVTSLAIGAFLGAGSTTEHGAYSKVIKRAVAWLCKQASDGLIQGDRPCRFALVDHAVATLALVAAAETSRSTDLKSKARDALDALVESRNADGAWGYGPSDRKSDLAPTGLALWVLQEAKSWYPVPKVVSRGRKWLLAHCDAKSGRFAAAPKHGRPEAEGKMPGSSSVQQTAIGLLAGYYGRKLTPPANHSVEWLGQNKPEWRPSKIDFLYWWCGTLALTGRGREGFRSWWKAVESALLTRQEGSGHARGSWDPVGFWGEEGGRVQSTALAVLALEACKRVVIMRR